MAMKFEIIAMDRSTWEDSVVAVVVGTRRQAIAKANAIRRKLNTTVSVAEVEGGE